MGKIFVGKVWTKERPMIEIEKDGIIYHAGISHTLDKKGMIPIAQNDICEGSEFEVHQNSYAGLCHKIQLKGRNLGYTKKEFDEKLLKANSKLKQKIEKRQK